MTRITDLTLRVYRENLTTCDQLGQRTLSQPMQAPEPTTHRADPGSPYLLTVAPGHEEN